jgi:hypothetical protein
MWKIGGDTWTYSTACDPDIDLCVWALRRDGLRVPPFDRHPEGDGRLRAAGLTADGWWAWFTTVVGRIAATDQRLRSGPSSGWRRTSASTAGRRHRPS